MFNATIPAIVHNIEQEENIEGSKSAQPFEASNSDDRGRFVSLSQVILHMIHCLHLQRYVSRDSRASKEA